MKSTGIKTSFFRADAVSFGGYVLDPRDLPRRFSVEILLDGISTHVVHAEVFDPELLRKGYGDGCYAFAFVIPSDRLTQHHWIEACLANQADAVGKRISLRKPLQQGRKSAFGPGQVRWVGGLCLEGEIEVGDGKEPIENHVLYVQVDGEPVAPVRPRDWSSLRDLSGEIRAVASFQITLPNRYSDGKVHQVHVTTSRNEELTGSPLSFIASPDDVRTILSELADVSTELYRTQILDHLIPPAVPFHLYEDWRERFKPARPDAGENVKVAVIAVGDGDPSALGKSLHQQTHTNWLTCPATAGDTLGAFDRRRILSFLTDEASNVEVVVWALARSTLGEQALAWFAAAFSQHPSASAVYADLEIVTGDGGSWPMCFPAFDYERMLEQGYCAFLFACSRTAAIDALERGAENVYREFNSLIDHRDDVGARVVHLPFILASLAQADIPQTSDLLAKATQDHLTARGVGADITASKGALFPSVHVRRHIRARAGKVSIVIAARNHVELLSQCLDSIAAADTNLIGDIVIADNESSDLDTVAYLNKINGSRAKVVCVPGPFNRSALTNRAVDAAKDDYVCLLAPDMKITTNDWLPEMVSRMMDPGVGAVGALITWPNGVVLHGGMVFGAQFSARNAFTDRMTGDAGYGDLLKVAHECSAVSGRCLLLRRHDYDAIGGLDETAFPDALGDVDLCLKLRARGFQIVFTPHAHLSCQEGATSRSTSWHAHRLDRDLISLRQRWGAVLVDDLCYNPGLALDPIPFAGLAWPPRPRAPRLSGEAEQTRTPRIKRH